MGELSAHSESFVDLAHHVRGNRLELFLVRNLLVQQKLSRSDRSGRCAFPSIRLRLRDVALIVMLA
jgi:hypothetical protein